MSGYTPVRLSSIRAVFMALFDAVETMGEWNEDRWGDLIAAFNATGRLVLGFPHLESSESDIFGALDDIAGELQTTKESIEKVTADARVILRELTDAIGMGEPETAPEPTPDRPEPPIVEPDEPLSEPDPGSEAAPVPDVPGSEPVSLPPDPIKHSGQIEPVRPNEQDERLFAAVRRDPSISMAAAEREAGLAQSRGIQRLKLLDGYGTLPDDIKQWREVRSKARGVPKGVSSLYMHQEAKRPAPTSIPEALTGESFEDRRLRAAREASERTWAQRHGSSA